ncbi:hypothetical protein Ac2012v2_000544 [Leucoagaricus gongylophorus]
MSDTESDQDNDNAEADFDEISKFGVGESPSLDAILQVLGNDDQAYNQSIDSLCALVGHLDLLVQEHNPRLKQRAILVFQHLVTGKTIDQLLQLRFKLRAHSTGSRACSPALVDKIISQLGTLVLFIANDSDENWSHAAPGESLRNQMERDSMRAASQLPDCWNALASALTLHHGSPATKRLIIRLLFGVLVMQQDLNKSIVSSSDYDFMLLSSALETIIGEYVSFDAVTGSPIILRDQLDCAFFLNLYATVRTMNPDPADGHVVCKPYIESHTLALIDLVLFPTNDYPEKTPSSQIAYIVCFCWGKLLSWSWVTWADQRFVSAEIVCFITRRWLETIKCDATCSKHRKCVLALSHLLENAFASFAALSDTLARGVGQWEMDHESLLRLLDQICSFILPILHEGSRGNDFQSSDCLRPYTSKVCRSVLLLCTRERISYDRDKARDSYLDLLLSMDETILRQSLVELQTERAAQFSGNLDCSALYYDIECALVDSFSVFSEAKGYLNEALISPAHLSMIRFSLGFLTILCNADIRGLFLREKISSFFMKLSNRLVSNEGYRKVLLGPLLTALAAAGKYFSPSNPFSSLTEDDGFWRLCLHQPCDNFHSNMALAQYILQCSYFPDSLLLLETLDHFRTIVLKILEDELPHRCRDVLRLSFPVFCQVIVHLLTRETELSRVIKQFFISSPWTMVLFREMKRMLASPLVSTTPGDALYHLWNVIRSTGTLLVQVLSGDVVSDQMMKVPRIRLLLYQSQIIPVSVIDSWSDA